MPRLLDWIEKFAWPIVFGCIGAAIGLAIKYPADWNPPDPTLNLLGGLVGSVGSVAAAFLVLRRQFAHEASKDAQRERAVRRKIGRVFTTLLVEIECSIHKMDGKTPVPVTEFVDRLTKLIPTLQKYEHVLPSQMEAWMAFDEECVMFFETTRVALQSLSAACETLREEGAYVPQLPLPARFKDNWERLIEGANVLVDDVAQLSGDKELLSLTVDPRKDLSLVLTK